MDYCTDSQLWCGEPTLEEDNWTPLFEPESLKQPASSAAVHERVADKKSGENRDIEIESVNSRVPLHDPPSENYSFQLTHEVPNEDEPQRTCRYYMLQNLIYVLPSFGSSEPCLDYNIVYPTIPPSRSSNSSSNILVASDALDSIRSAFDPNLTQLLPLLQNQYRFLVSLCEYRKCVRSSSPLGLLARPSIELLSRGDPYTLEERVERLIGVNCALYSSLSTYGLVVFSRPTRYNVR